MSATDADFSQALDKLEDGQRFVLSGSHWDGRGRMDAQAMAALKLADITDDPRWQRNFTDSAERLGLFRDEDDYLWEARRLAGGQDVEMLPVGEEEEAEKRFWSERLWGWQKAFASCTRLDQVVEIVESDPDLRRLLAEGGAPQELWDAIPPFDEHGNLIGEAGERQGGGPKPIKFMRATGDDWSVHVGLQGKVED